MKILSTKTSAPVPLPPGAAVSLGFFDGVHIGHREMIAASRRFADSAGIPCAVWMIGGSYKGETPLLTDERDKLSLLYEAGADYAVLSDFDSVRSMTGEEFVRELLVRELGISAVFCGFNFRFGKGAAWNAGELSDICRELGISCHVIPAVTLCAEAVSSSRIRALISGGKVREAAELLGRPYSVTLPVLEGKKLGRTLGFPTVNQVIPPWRVSPGAGVYAVEAVLENGKSYSGVANIGVCPTIEALPEGSGEGAATAWRAVCETYIVDYSGDLYGKDVEVRFLRRIRGEKKFQSLDELKRQIESDAELAAATADGEQ